MQIFWVWQLDLLALIISMYMYTIEPIKLLDLCSCLYAVGLIWHILFFMVRVRVMLLLVLLLVLSRYFRSPLEKWLLWKDNFDSRNSLFCMIYGFHAGYDVLISFHIKFCSRHMQVMLLTSSRRKYCYHQCCLDIHSGGLLFSITLQMWRITRL